MRWSSSEARFDALAKKRNRRIFEVCETLYVDNELDRCRDIGGAEIGMDDT